MYSVVLNQGWFSLPFFPRGHLWNIWKHFWLPIVVVKHIEMLLVSSDSRPHRYCYVFLECTLTLEYVNRVSLNIFPSVLWKYKLWLLFILKALRRKTVNAWNTKLGRKCKCKAGGMAEPLRDLHSTGETQNLVRNYHRWANTGWHSVLNLMIWWRPERSKKISWRKGCAQSWED